MSTCYQCGSHLQLEVHTKYSNGTQLLNLTCYSCFHCGAKGHTLTTEDGQVVSRQGPACQYPADVRNPEVTV